LHDTTCGHSRHAESGSSLRSAALSRCVQESRWAATASIFCIWPMSRPDAIGRRFTDPLPDIYIRLISDSRRELCDTINGPYGRSCRPYLPGSHHTDGAPHDRYRFTAAFFYLKPGVAFLVRGSYGALSSSGFEATNAGKRWKTETDFFVAAFVRYYFRRAHLADW